MSEYNFNLRNTMPRTGDGVDLRFYHPQHSDWMKPKYLMEGTWIVKAVKLVDLSFLLKGLSSRNKSESE